MYKFLLTGVVALINVLPIPHQPVTCEDGYSPASQEGYGYSYYTTQDCTGQEYSSSGRTWDLGGCVQDGSGVTITSESSKAPQTGYCGVQTVYNVQGHFVHR